MKKSNKNFAVSNRSALRVCTIMTIILLLLGLYLYAAFIGFVAALFYIKIFYQLKQENTNEELLQKMSDKINSDDS